MATLFVLSIAIMLPLYIMREVASYQDLSLNRFLWLNFNIPYYRLEEVDGEWFIKSRVDLLGLPLPIYWGTIPTDTKDKDIARSTAIFLL